MDRILNCSVANPGKNRGREPREQPNSKLQAQIVIVLVRRSRPRKKFHDRWKGLGKISGYNIY
jgi:hypothetical protein